MGKRIFIVFSVLVGVMVFSGCTKSHKAETLTLPIIKNKDFGSICVKITIDDFNAKGYKLGDSVDVKFSNGYELNDIPYCDGYYAKPGNFLVVGYPGNPWVLVAANFASSWDMTGVTEKDTATISLNKAGGFDEVQKTFSLKYSNDRNDYATDEIFANFRAMDCSTLRKDLIYRSASPCDNKFNRAQVCDSLCKKAAIQYALNLSDDVEKYQSHKAKEDFNSPYYDSLVQNNCISFMRLKISYMSEDYMKTVAKGIVEMLESDTEGPVVIHCVEGKDRTGYLCILLASLSGANYDEMVKDYMITFKNYYGVTEKQRERYNLIKENNFDSFLDAISSLVPGEKEKDIKSRNYVDIARAYFKLGGMTDEQISSLEKFIKA